MLQGDSVLGGNLFIQWEEVLIRIEAKRSRGWCGTEGFAFCGMLIQFKFDDSLLIHIFGNHSSFSSVFT